MTIVPRFMWSWPSWRVELVSGLVCVGGAWLGALILDRWVPRGVVMLLAPHLMSLLYEFVFDANDGVPGHQPWADIRERELGILLGLCLWMLIR